MNIEKQRKLAAATFPKEWARTLTMTGAKRRSHQAMLRKAAIEKEAVRPIIAKGGKCANCAHASTPHYSKKLTCELDSDFQGDQIVRPDHVCSRHKEQT